MNAGIGNTRLAYPKSILGAALLALAGCTMFALVYDNAGRLLLGYADKYLDLNAEQKEQLALDLDVRLARHRRFELPGYVRDLEVIEGLAADGLTDADVDEIVARVRGHVAEAILNTLPFVAAVMSDLSSGQIGHFRNALDEANREYTEKYLPEAKGERLEKRTERMIDKIEDWTDSLSEEQMASIGRISAQLPDVGWDWYRYRVSEQQGLLTLLSQGAGAAAISEYLTQWLIQRARLGPELKQSSERWLQGMKSMAVTVDGSLSPSQRQHLLEQIRSRRDAFASALGN